MRCEILSDVAVQNSHPYPAPLAWAGFGVQQLAATKGDDEEAAKEMQIATTLQARKPPKRIRLGGQMMSTKLIHQVRPSYPVETKMAGIQGTVRLEAVIGNDGAVQDLKLLSGHPDLAKAAMKAVSKWRYQPTLLNGEPVEVVTEIEVYFALARN